MLDISFAELALTFIIALVVLGPERLPKVARSVGYWMGRARSAFNHFKDELEREAYNLEMREKFKQQLEEMGLDDDNLKLGQDLTSSNSGNRQASAEQPHSTAEQSDVPPTHQDGDTQGNAPENLPTPPDNKPS